MKAFSTQTTGKWILVGEHAVLRGSPALVFPLETARLDFSFCPQDGKSEIGLVLEGPFGPELDLLFWGVLEKACGMTGIRRADLKGEARIANQIPVGAGLGASAAFCVAVARWFQAMGGLEENRIEEFARELENLFHGESSGVDIAVAHGGRALKFKRGEKPEDLHLSWKPSCYLSYSGHRGVTRECVGRVKDLLREKPDQALLWDRQMQTAVEMAEQALAVKSPESTLILKKSFELAADCFRSWGLFDQESEMKAQQLLRQGALAVKPTGSGGGGYLLSLWADRPSADVDLLACFA